MFKECRILNKQTNEAFFGSLDLELLKVLPFIEVPIKFDGKKVMWNGKEIVETGYTFQELYSIKLNELEENYIRALEEERLIDDLYFTLNDSFRVMIKTDIDSARELGITAITGLRDVRGNIISISIEQAQQLYKKLWVYNKLLYIKFIQTQQQLFTIYKQSVLTDDEKLGLLNEISLDLGIDKNQVETITSMDAQQLNAFVQNLNNINV